jgi:hypothetical protein
MDNTEPTKAEKTELDFKQDPDVTAENLGQDEVDLKKHFPDEEVGKPAPTLDEIAAKAKFDKKIAELKKLYNSFAIKDMSFENFVKEYMDLTDPVQINNEVARIVNQIELGKQNKRAMDSVLTNMN